MLHHVALDEDDEGVDNYVAVVDRALLGAADADELQPAKRAAAVSPIELSTTDRRLAHPRTGVFSPWSIAYTLPIAVPRGRHIASA